MIRLQESLFSQLCPQPGQRYRRSDQQSRTSEVLAPYTQTGAANLTTAQTFEETKEEEDDDDDEGGSEGSFSGKVENELDVDKEQLNAAKVLILKQRQEMVVLIKRMRDMNQELKALKSEQASER